MHVEHADRGSLSRGEVFEPRNVAWPQRVGLGSLLGDVAKLRLSGRSHGADSRENA
jgi:hypothetical protein